MDASAYGNLAHKAIESKNIKHELQEQIGDDIMRYAHEQAGHHVGGKFEIPKGLKDFGHGFVKGLKDTKKIQNLNSDSCGWFCLYCIKYCEERGNAPTSFPTIFIAV